MTFKTSVSSVLTMTSKHNDRSNLQVSDRQPGLSNGLTFKSFGRASSTQSFGTLSSGDDESERGNVGRNSSDLFKFKIKEKSKVSLDVTIRELFSDRYIRGSLLNSNRSNLESTDKLRAPFDSDDFSTKLKPGDYYVNIATDGKKVNYKFKLSVD
jgi:hypothetical protein